MKVEVMHTRDVHQEYLSGHSPGVDVKLTQAENQETKCILRRNTGLFSSFSWASGKGQMLMTIIQRAAWDSPITVLIGPSSTQLLYTPQQAAGLELFLEMLPGRFTNGQSQMLSMMANYVGPGV